MTTAIIRVIQWQNLFLRWCYAFVALFGDQEEHNDTEQDNEKACQEEKSKLIL